MKISLSKEQISFLRWTEEASIENNAAAQQRARDLVEFREQLQKFFLLEAGVSKGGFKLTDDGTALVEAEKPQQQEGG